MTAAPVTADSLLESVRRHREIAGTTSHWHVEVDELSADLMVVQGRYELPGRQGGVTPGPVQADIIDTLAWMLTLYRLPPESDAFTTDLGIQFLRPLRVGPFSARTTMERWSPRRAVSTVHLFAAGGELSTLATVTYAPQAAGMSASGGLGAADLQ